MTSDIVDGLRTINAEVKKIKALVEGQDPDMALISKRINRQVYLVYDLVKGGPDRNDPATFDALMRLYELTYSALQEVGQSKNLARWVKAMQG